MFFEAAISAIATLGGIGMVRYHICVRVTGERGGAPPWSANKAAARLGTSNSKGCSVAEPTEIFAWRRIDNRITTSGQPTEEQLARVRDLGVTHIVNLGLHTHEKALMDEAASVEALGMTYVHIPVDFDDPTEADFERFCKVMAELRDTPIHVHCIVNARVTAFFYRYQRDVLCRTEQECRAVMDTVWQPGGVWAAFIGDEAAVALPHRPARTTP